MARNSTMTSATKEVDASSLLATDDGEAVCYLCLDGRVDDETGQPLRRDCACRGSDAGFVHLSCLTKYAEIKSKQARGMNAFRDPWRVCPGCHQIYQNELKIDITSEFVSFVRTQYPGDTERQMESLHLKMRALGSMFERLQPRQKREYGVTANVLLSLIDRMKGDTLSPLPRRYSWVEADAYHTHGRIALSEGTQESARRAVDHFEKYLKVNEANGFAGGVSTAKSNIALAKSKYEGGNNNEEILKASQELYELHIAEDGEGNEYTIRAGKYYAVDLQKANRRGEARELLTKLLATSKQVLGPHHNTTKVTEATLKQVVAELKIVN